MPRDMKEEWFQLWKTRLLEVAEGFVLRQEASEKLDRLEVLKRVNQFLEQATEAAVWTRVLDVLTKETHLRQWAQWFEGTMYYYRRQYEAIRVMSLQALNEERRQTVEQAIVK